MTHLTDLDIIEVLRTQQDYVYDSYNKKHIASVGKFKYIYRDLTKKITSFYVESSEMDCLGVGYNELLNYVIITKDVKNLEKKMGACCVVEKKKFKI